MKKGNFLKINDTVSFSLINPDLIKIKDDYEGAFKNEPPGQLHPTGLGTVYGGPEEQEAVQNNLQTGLQVSIAATHAGIITRNNGFYLPDKMKKGSESFLKDFQKPVLVHHQDDKDPIGRIINARYIDTSGIITDKYELNKGMSVRDKSGKEIGVITDKMIQDFCSNKMPFGMQLEVATTLFKDSFLQDEGYSGLGFINIIANITDPEAIQKFLDGRYLTGSVGATTDKAICSVCKQDWTIDGKCEHRPGGIYDKMPCYIIAGDLDYEEFSVVNKPADRHAKVLELNYNGITDSIETIDDYTGRIYEARLDFPQYDSVNKEDTVTEVVKDKDASNVIEDSVQVETSPAEEQDVKAEIEDSLKPTEGAEEIQDDANDKDSLEVLLDKVFSEDEMSEEDEEKLYELMLDELTEEDGFNLVDAKLSTEKRKKLASSTFCGPKRSFPVPDCAHVTAARRLINRYKGPGDKSEIMKCVDRKAKALGCESKKKDSVEDEVQVEDSMLTLVMHQILELLDGNSYAKKDGQEVLSDEEIKTFRSILKRLSNLVGTEDFVKAALEEKLVKDFSNVDALEAEIVKNEENIGDLRDQLAAMRKEYKAVLDDLSVVQDSLVSEKLSTRKAQEEYLNILSSLKDKECKDRDFSELSNEDLKLRIQDSLEDIDIGIITDKLNDGMSRIPTETVENLETEKIENQKRYKLEEMAKAEEQYWTIRFSQGIQIAEAFRRQKQKEGILPPDEEG